MPDDDLTPRWTVTCPCGMTRRGLDSTAANRLAEEHNQFGEDHSAALEAEMS